MSFRLNTTVPHAISNKAFRSSFTGIYDVTFNFNYQVFHGFQVGVQYHHNLWKTPDNKIPGLNVYGQTHLAGIRVGYDLIRSQTSTAYIGLAAEQGIIKYNGLTFSGIPPNADPSTIHSIRDIQVDAGIFFYTEGNFAIGLNISSTFTNYRFDPFSIYLNQQNPNPYLADDVAGNWSYFTFGFNVVYSFWRTKGGTE
ncbi:MAG: hypothetical protein M3R17_05050 [Bacteroidota bacterium]|nr:hypothetical protein [Bacteroidota bacterium]